MQPIMNNLSNFDNNLTKTDPLLFREKKGENSVLSDILKHSKINLDEVGDILHPKNISNENKQKSIDITNLEKQPGTPSFSQKKEKKYDPDISQDFSGIDLSQLQEIGKLKKTALLHYQNKRPLEALKVLEKAISILPGDLELIYYEALCLFQLQKYERVATILSELEKLDEEKILSGLGKIRSMCLLRTSQFTQAENYIRDLLIQNKNDRQLLNMLAYSLERQDKLNDAKIVLQRILEKDEYNINACNSLAYVLYRRDENLSKALELIRRALNSEPENPLYLHTLGMVLHKKGQKLQAITALKKAIFFDPKNATIQKHFEELSKDIPRH